MAQINVEAETAGIVSRIERLLSSAAQTGDRSAGGQTKTGPGDDEDHLRDLALDAPVIDLVSRLAR